MPAASSLPNRATSVASTVPVKVSLVSPAAARMPPWPAANSMSLAIDVLSIVVSRPPLSVTTPVPRDCGLVACNSPAVDARAAAVAVGARQHGGADTDLGHRAVAADRVVHRHEIAAVEGQRAAVEDLAIAELAGGAAIADLQGAGIDGGRSDVAVAAAEHERGAAGLPQRPDPAMASPTVTGSRPPRLKTNAPLLTIAPPPRLPLVPPLPTCSVPAAMLVPPV